MLWVGIALVSLAYILYWTASEVERRYNALDGRGLTATPLYTLLTDRREECAHCGAELDCRRGIKGWDDYIVLWAVDPETDRAVRWWFHPKCFVRSAGQSPDLSAPSARVAEEADSDRAEAVEVDI